MKASTSLSHSYKQEISAKERRRGLKQTGQEQGSTSFAASIEDKAPRISSQDGDAVAADGLGAGMRLYGDLVYEI